MAYATLKKTSVEIHTSRNNQLLIYIFIIYNAKDTVYTPLYIFIMDREVIEVLFDICINTISFDDYYDII